MHAHTKELAIATLDDAPKPAQPADFVPIDPLGWHHPRRPCPCRLVRRAERLARDEPSGVPSRLAEHPATDDPGPRDVRPGPDAERGVLPDCASPTTPARSSGRRGSWGGRRRIAGADRRPTRGPFPLCARSVHGRGRRGLRVPRGDRDPQGIPKGRRAHLRIAAVARSIPARCRSAA